MPDPEETAAHIGWEEFTGFEQMDAEAVTLRERVRERLVAILTDTIATVADDDMGGFEMDAAACEAADAIMREFALRPVSQGKVDAETGEVG